MRLSSGERMVLGGGFLAGIGFTKTLFVASLALEGEILGVAKVGVIGGSVVDASTPVKQICFALLALGYSSCGCGTVDRIR